MDLRNKKIDQDSFMTTRAEVLSQWPTGNRVDLKEAAAFHQSLPEGKIFSASWSRRKRKRKP